jgi:hypothetical protein
MHRFPSFTRLRPVALLAVLMAALTGCGAGKGEVRGTVRFNGRPLPSGTVLFLGADGIPRAGQIQPDGTFSALVPAGPAKVIVCCLAEGRPSRSASRGRAAPPPGSLIPARYADWNTSGLTVLVKPGQTVQDLALTFP